MNSGCLRSSWRFRLQTSIRYAEAFSAYRHCPLHRLLERAGASPRRRHYHANPTAEMFPGLAAVRPPEPSLLGNLIGVLFDCVAYWCQQKKNNKNKTKSMGLM